MRRRLLEPLAPKVPEISLLFWIIKVLTTGTGEAASDYLGETSLVLGGVVGVGGFAWAMLRQLRARRYHAPTYWTAVLMVAVFGTIAADVVHVVLDVPYALSTAGYALVTAGLFVYWQRTEGTLSIHSIVTTRREVLYWATVLSTFALGTAAGDLTALALHWGFLPSGLLFLAVIGLPLLAWRVGLNATAAFWTAYVLTRPLGASFADWLGKPASRGGGLGYGDATVVGLSLLVIAVLVARLAATGADVQPELVSPELDLQH